MKILHTADWHLGKKIDGKPLMENIRRSILEINDICERENPDAVLIVGDIFDTAVPSSEAEELFYESAELLSRGRAVIAIAGNHDDPIRLCAARTLARKHNIYLIGDLDNSFYDDENAKGGEGWLKLRLPNGILNLAALPYPLESFIGGGDESYTDRVKRAVDKCCSVFSDDGLNLLAAHVFCLDGDSEQSLGGAKILPKTIFPESAHYCALGHIHKPMKVSESPLACYSGSIIQCNFGEEDNKSVSMISFDNEVRVRQIPLNSYKKLIRITVKNFDEALEKTLEAEDFVEILYDSLEPVSSAEMAKLRAMPSFVKFTPIAERTESQSSGRKKMSDSELFEAFFREKKGEDAPSELVEMFVKAVNGEEIL